MGADTSETRRASGKARGLTTGPEKALAAIRSIPGVLDAFYPDKGYLSLIRREEESILAAGGIGTRNEGLIRVMDRRHIIIAVTCPADMPFTVDEPTVELRTRDGELMGTNITESMRPAYEGRQD